MSHIQGIATRPDKLKDPVYVLTCVFNPYRYRSRWALYNKFAHHVAESGGILCTAEIALGERDFAVTRSDNPHHLQLRSPEILWHKERAINLLARILPHDWKYMAWVDADVTFARSDWVNDTRHQLQIHPIIQLFKIAIDLDYNHNPLAKHLSFASSYMDGLPKPTKTNGIYQDVKIKSPAGDAIAWHPGFAWAIRRDAYNAVGGLFDVSILGAGDNHMAKSVIGDGAHSYHPAMADAYKSAVLTWQERAEILKRNMGFLDGTLLHHWHGPKANRLYWDRWRILTETKFDPTQDLLSDWHGLYQLNPKRHVLAHRIRQYFRQRNEDAID